MRIILIILFFITGSLVSQAQNLDSLYTGSDTLLTLETEYAERFVPRKASLYSAVLPGLGQAYNKSYWKIPLVYGGFIGFYLAIDYYHDLYTIVRQDLFAELDDNPLTVKTTNLTEPQLRRRIDQFRRDRDFYIVLAGVFYFLQIAEAHIDAHLKEFKLNPELRVTVDPQIRYAQGINSGISLKLKF